MCVQTYMKLGLVIYIRLRFQLRKYVLWTNFKSLCDVKEIQ
jgi:hypothetical protein